MPAPVAKPVSATPVTSTQATAVLDAAILSLLSQPDLARLVAILEPLQSTQSAIQVGEVLRAAVAAAATGDAVQALQKVSELIGLDPLKSEAVRADPGLAPVRGPVDALLARLANLARLDAETRVSDAAHAVQTGAVKTLPEWEARPEALVSIANQLLDAGGHLNSVRASQVAQVVIDASHWAPALVAEPVSAEAPVPQRRGVSGTEPVLVRSFSRSWMTIRKRAPARLAALWRRAPLLMLLLGWFAVGIAAGLVSWVQRKILPDAVPDGLTDAAFSLWGLGFLALVLFGFYVRVRNVKM